MQCPICGGAAEAIRPTASSANAVRCADCGDYDISQTAEAALSQRETHGRIVALRFAQTNAEAGRRPHIHGLT